MIMGERMIFGIVNNKGGVLKTTLSTNLAASLSLSNKKVIIVDLDGQGNVIATFGKNPNNMTHTIIDFLRNDCHLNDCIVEQRKNLFIIPGNDDLNFFDYYVQSNEIKQSDLKLTLKKLNEVYDYVIIDTPPNMSTVVAIVLSVCDVAIIPFEPDQYAILGLKRIVDATKEFKNKGNANMKVIAVPTKVNTRVTIHNEIIEHNIRPKLTSQNVYVTKTFISASTKSTASVGYEKVPIVLSVVKSKYQDEYVFLKEEIINYINSLSKIEISTTNNNLTEFNNKDNANSYEANINKQKNDQQKINIYGSVTDYNTFNNEKENSEAPCLHFNYSDKKENKD